MKQRFRKLLSLAAAGVLAAALFVTPAAAADAVENGNEAFDRWAAEAAIAERQRMEQLTGLPEDPQAAFEEAAAILEAIENARVMTPIADNEPALVDRDGEPLENETPEKLWAEFVAQFGGGSELSDEEEFPYELRFFTVAGEERFAIYDTRSGRAAAGWQGSTGKWWYSYGDGTWASGWTTINGLTYYFDPNNNDYMVHGWLSSGNKYFMGTPGQMDSGALYTFGWLNDKENGGTDAKPLWYYFEKNGAMAHGWVEYKGERYYMGEPGYPDTGLMYNGGFLTENKNEYYIGSDGITKRNWFQIGGDLFHGDSTYGALSKGTVRMSKYVTSTFGSNYRWRSDSMNSLGSANGKIIENTRWANLNVRDNGKRGPTLSLAGTDEFNQKFSGGDTSLIEDTADYYNDNTDGLVVVNTGGNYITAENAMVVVACGHMLYPEIAAVTFKQNAEGLWVSGLQYVLETDQINELVEGYYIGENVKAIIVFNKNCTDTQNLTLAQKKHVLRHELGHAIGLRHTFDADYGETEPGIISLMHPNCMSKYSSLTFTDYDMGELNKVYP